MTPSAELVHLEVVRDFMAASTPLRDGLAETEPWLEPSLETLAQELPRPLSVGSFVHKPFYRPPGSDRCFYCYPSSTLPKGLGAGRAVLAFKGLEPCADDFDLLISHLGLPSPTPHDIAEHLIFEEQKIPACLGLAEALDEADQAVAIQAAHLQAYGALARLPLPLFVFRHSGETGRRVVEKLRTALSRRAFETVEPWVEAGLGVYVYYYPTPPTRARDVDDLLHGLSFRRRMFALMRLCDPEEVVGRWVRGFARMLYLGFVPGSLASLRTGLCCQPQNACIDGGFVDLGSLTPLGELKDDTAVDAALEISFDALLQTVAALVTGDAGEHRQGHDVRADLHHLSRHLLALLQDCVESEHRPGLSLDPRVRRYLAPSRSFADLVERLGAYHSRSESEIVGAAATFGEFGLDLIAAARDQPPPPGPA